MRLQSRVLLQHTQWPPCCAIVCLQLRRKEREFISMQKLKQRTEEAHRRLSADITRLKQQKVGKR